MYKFIELKDKFFLTGGLGIQSVSLIYEIYFLILNGPKTAQNLA